MEKLKLYFFVGYPGALTITLPIFFVQARFSLTSLDERSSYLQCCNNNLETAILNLNILDNTNIHQALLVSAQLAVALTIMDRAEIYPPGDASFCTAG